MATTLNQKEYMHLRDAVPRYAVINYTGAAAAEVVAAQAGHRIVVLAYYVTANGTNRLTFVSDSASPTVLTGSMFNADLTNAAPACSEGLFATVSGENLGLQADAGTDQYDGFLTYKLVPSA